jgi:peptidoglycan hydrolase-like protein with peptidoglycan-binding domain
MRSIRLMAACIGLVVGFGMTRASAAELTAEAINDAAYRKDLPAHNASATGVRLQVLLDRAHFSPGEIDGKFGDNARKALRAFAESSNCRAPIPCPKRSGPGSRRTIGRSSPATRSPGRTSPDLSCADCRRKWKR